MLCTVLWEKEGATPGESSGMQYVCIVNPVAGKGSPAGGLAAKFAEFCRKKGVPCRIETTKAPGDAEEIARRYASEGKEVRILAVGGDGTLGEAARGVMGSEAAVGILPCGSGDDYVRTFGKKEQFLSFEGQLSAREKVVDMIACRDESGPRPTALNLCSMGLDAKVAMNMTRLKKIPFVRGSMAYNLSLLQCLCGKLGLNLSVQVDGGEVITGCFLFALAGSGRYYGGGYCGAPRALPDDGLLDFILIRKPKLWRIPGLISVYKNGQHLDSEKMKDLTVFLRGKTVGIRGDKPNPVNRDGECEMGTQVCFSVLPGAVRFLVPAKGT